MKNKAKSENIFEHVLFQKIKPKYSYTKIKYKLEKIGDCFPTKGFELQIPNVKR